MTDPRIRRIVIVGGGTAGWMAAAPLARMLARRDDALCEVLLIESPEIGTIGVGEATLPTLRYYNETLEIDEADFLRHTQGSYKLGIEFCDWGRLGHRFFHGFGDFGPAIALRSSFAHWLRLHHAGRLPLASYEDWSVPTVMARHNRFTPPRPGAPSAANAYAHAYQFDAGLYAAYLRRYAEARGAQRLEGTVVRVELRADDGFVAAVHLADGRRIDGDLFIDCTGFRALLIQGALQAGYDDWRHWLPCDSALAVPCARVEPLTPYTRSTARTAGWQWRIPLQHRTGNGHVYCSGFSSDAAASELLMAHLDGEPGGQPRQLRFVTGMRRRAWVKNVVAVGLSGGFLEPLESTSIQLIMDAVGRLIELFPDRHCQPRLADEYNRRMARQYTSIRDFILLHYKLTQRTDSDFWRHCAALPLPDTLAHQIELFRSTGQVAILDPDGFGEPSWISLLMGLGAVPGRHHPMIDLVPEQALITHFERLRQAINATVAEMPLHADYLARHARADLPKGVPADAAGS